MVEEPWLSRVGASILMQMGHVLAELHFPTLHWQEGFPSLR